MSSCDDGANDGLKTFISNIEGKYLSGFQVKITGWLFGTVEILFTKYRVFDKYVHSNVFNSIKNRKINELGDIVTHLIF